MPSTRLYCFIPTPTSTCCYGLYVWHTTEQRVEQRERNNCSWLTTTIFLMQAVKSSDVKLLLQTMSLMYRKICNQYDQEMPQQDLQRLQDWENTWKMSFNPSKCNTTPISPSKRIKGRTSDDLPFLSWTTAGGDELQQIPRDNHHRWPLLVDRQCWDSGGQRKQDCGLSPEEF